jgi:hypothetical protein
LSSARAFRPARTDENSPAFQRRDKLEKYRVPPGRRDWFTMTANPGVETPGYFQNVPAGQVKGNLRRLSFEIFIPAIILDGNS